MSQQMLFGMKFMFLLMWWRCQLLFLTAPGPRPASQKRTKNASTHSNDFTCQNLLALGPHQDTPGPPDDDLCFSQHCGCADGSAFLFSASGRVQNAPVNSRRTCSGGIFKYPTSAYSDQRPRSRFQVSEPYLCLYRASDLPILEPYFVFRPV